MQRMSILFSLFVLVGVTSSRHISNHINDGGDGPIELPEARRICASLCMSGLGGKGCGKHCEAISPFDLPIQSNPNATADASSFSTRRNACPLLCGFQLGDPLCHCPTEIFETDIADVDFDQICSFFCVNHNYNILGCRSCDVYQTRKEQELYRATHSKARDNIDWDKWCRERCSQGDGGAACNCDKLPLMLSLDIAPQDEIK